MAEERDDLTKKSSESAGAGRLAHENEKELKAEAQGVQDGADRSDEARQIMGDIRETRSHMGETIDAIQDRLSLSNISEQVSERVNTAVESAKDAVYEATIGKATTMMKDVSNTAVVRSVKDNPLPFALIGVGAGLLAHSAYAGKKGDRYKNWRYVKNSPGSTAPSSEERGAALMDNVSAKANEAYDKVAEKADTAYQGATEMLSKAKDTASEYGDQAKAIYDRHIEETPLAVGAVALALGAAVGLAIPSTRYEDQWLGEARDDLFEKAQGTASELLDKTKKMVTESAGPTSNH